MDDQYARRGVACYVQASQSLVLFLIQAAKLLTDHRLVKTQSYFLMLETDMSPVWELILTVLFFPFE